MKNLWRIRVFIEKGWTRYLHFWSNFDTRFHLKMVEIEKNAQ